MFYERKYLWNEMERKHYNLQSTPDYLCMNGSS